MNRTHLYTVAEAAYLLEISVSTAYKLLKGVEKAAWFNPDSEKWSLLITDTGLEQMLENLTESLMRKVEKRRARREFQKMIDETDLLLEQMDSNVCVVNLYLTKKNEELV